MCDFAINRRNRRSCPSTELALIDETQKLKHLNEWGLYCGGKDCFNFDASIAFSDHNPTQNSTNTTEYEDDSDGYQELTSDEEECPDQHDFDFLKVFMTLISKTIQVDWSMLKTRKNPISFFAFLMGMEKCVSLKNLLWCGFAKQAWSVLVTTENIE